MTETKKFPFEVPYTEIEADVDPFIDVVFATLQSFFLVLPRGPGFITYPEFQQAYEVLKRHTAGFTTVEPDTVMNALQENALVFIVVRTMLGFTPPELAYVASQKTGTVVSQSFARTLDRRVRIKGQAFRSLVSGSQKRVTALVSTACQLLRDAVAKVPPGMIHRLDKADTRSGLASLRHLAAEGTPYAMLLYERFLGRPFAGHRDSVSGLVGEVMENAVEERLRQAGISHLIEISRRRRLRDKPGFQVIACIDGRGFGVRRQDMRKLLEATRGKVFTLKTLQHLIENTALKAFESR